MIAFVLKMFVHFPSILFVFSLNDRSVKSLVQKNRSFKKSFFKKIVHSKTVLSIKKLVFLSLSEKLVRLVNKLLFYKICLVKNDSFLLNERVFVSELHKKCSSLTKTSPSLQDYPQRMII